MVNINLSQIFRAHMCNRDNKLKALYLTEFCSSRTESSLHLTFLHKQGNKSLEYMMGFASSEPQIFPCIQPFPFGLVSGKSAMLGLLGYQQCSVLNNSTPDAALFLLDFG
jgi:hypothetical protein